MKYYEATIKKLKQEVESLLNQNPYSDVLPQDEIFSPQEVFLTNDEAITHYEQEVAFVEDVLSKISEKLEKYGLILTREDLKGHQYKIVSPPSICQRTNEAGQSLLAPIAYGTYRDVYATLSQYLSELNNRVPALSSLADMRNALSSLTRFKSMCKKRLADLDKGKRGEESVIVDLQKLSYKYIVRDSIVLPAITGTQTSETDAYLITPVGIFIIEIKNIGDEKVTLDISKDGRWQKIKYGKAMPYSNDQRGKDPVEQNIMHKINTEVFLMEHGFTDVPLFPLVVIANNDVEVENKSDAVVLRRTKLVDYIESHQTNKVLSKEQMEQIANLFDTHKLEARKFPAITLSHKLENILVFFDKMLDCFCFQKKVELTLGNLFKQAVTDIVAINGMKAKEEDKQRAQRIKRIIGKSIGHILSAIIFVSLYFEVENKIGSAMWFKEILHEAGYLKKAINLIYLVSDERILFSIRVAAAIGTWMLSWLLPRMVWNNLRLHNKTYFFDSVVHLLAVTVGFFALLVVLAKGKWTIALLGYSLLTYLSWRIMKGKFFFKKVEAFRPQESVNMGKTPKEDIPDEPSWEDVNERFKARGTTWTCEESEEEEDYYEDEYYEDNNYHNNNYYEEETFFDDDTNTSFWNNDYDDDNDDSFYGGSNSFGNDDSREQFDRIDFANTDWNSFDPNDIIW